MIEQPSVVQALTLVMKDVQAVRKADRNQQQNFSFRGIDSVINAVGPALRTHGVVILPIAEEIEHSEFTTEKQKRMHVVTLKIRWRFHGPSGDFVEAVSYGESADAGDKAVPKAHSVAYRTVLLQALCIPTDEPDPDSQSYERADTYAEEQPAPPVNPLFEMRRKVQEASGGMTPDEIAADYAAFSGGLTAAAAAVPQLQKYLDHLLSKP